MSKIEALTDITGIAASATNNDILTAAIQNTLSRDGSTPNGMEANLDMSNFRIINLPQAVNPSEPVTLSQAASLAGVDTPLTTQTVGTYVYPVIAAETATGLVAGDMVMHYPHFDVRRYGATGGTGASDRTANSDAIDVACEVIRRHIHAQKADTTSTPHAALTFGGSLVYGVERSIWLGTTDTAASDWTKQHIRNVDLGGSVVYGYINDRPIFDWAGGSEGSRSMYNGKIVGSNSTNLIPSCGVLLARTNELDELGAPNAQNADPSWFVNVQIVGHFLLAPLYNYASELMRWVNGKLWNYYTGKAPCLIITNDNVRYNATSDYVTLADDAAGGITDAQSCIDFKFWGTFIQGQSTGTAMGSYNGNGFQAACVELWGVQEALFDGCFFNSPINDAHLNFVTESSSVQPARIVFTNGSFHSDNGTGASIKCGGTILSLTVTNNRNNYNTLVDHSTGQITRLTVYGNDTNDTIIADKLIGAHLVIQDALTVTTEFSGFIQTTGACTMSLPSDTTKLSGTWITHNGATESLNTGSFTATLTGCTTSPTGTVKYTVNEDLVTCEIPAITATSNTTACTLSGWPSEILPANAQTCIAVVTDNGTTSIAKVNLSAAGTFTLYKDGSSAVFTGSGTKGIQACTITYRTSA